MATHDKNEPRAEVPDEEEFVEGAKLAVQKAIANLHRSGIATTHLIDGTLVTILPDGSVAPVKGTR
jgi:hypothetical protein